MRRTTVTPSKDSLPKSAKSGIDQLRDRAFDLYRQKRYQDALNLFESIRDKQVYDYEGMARCYLKQNDFSKTLQLLKPFVNAELGSGNKRLILTTLSLTYQKLGLFDKARAVLEQLPDQNDPQAVYAWIRFHFENKEFETAFRKCLENEAKYPEHFHTFFSHAIKLIDDDCYSEVVALLHPFKPSLKELKKSYPRIQERHVAIANALLSIGYWGIGQITLADEYAKKAIGYDSFYAPGSSSLAKCHTSSAQKYQKSAGHRLKQITLFNEAQAVDPDRFEKNHGAHSAEVKHIQIEGNEDDMDDDFDLADMIFARLMRGPIVKIKGPIKMTPICDGWSVDEKKMAEKKMPEHLERLISEKKSQQPPLKRPERKLKRWDEELEKEEETETYSSLLKCNRFTFDNDDVEEEISVDTADNDRAEELSESKSPKKDVAITSPIMPAVDTNKTAEVNDSKSILPVTAVNSTIAPAAVNTDQIASNLKHEEDNTDPEEFQNPPRQQIYEFTSSGVDDLPDPKSRSLSLAKVSSNKQHPSWLASCVSSLFNNGWCARKTKSLVIANDVDVRVKIYPVN